MDDMIWECTYVHRVFLNSQDVGILAFNRMLRQPIYHNVFIPVVPHKAVAEVSKIGNL